MQFDKKLNLIKRVLKKKKELPIIELKIKDYNNSNFYLSLLYNQRIEKFKVLYIPLDVVEDTKIEEYCCYQFMEVKSVIYIMEEIKKGLPKYEKEKTRDFRNKNITNFTLELDVYLDKKQYQFYATRYLPKELKFFFEAVVMLFEHAPNIMSELATEILSVIMNTNENIEYQRSLNCDLETSDLKIYFPSLQNEKELKKGKIDFLENINGKYYGIIEKHLVIIEYNNNRKILNIYCDKKELVYSIYTYQILQKIKNKKERKFFKINITDKKENIRYNFLCLGVTKTGMRVIKQNKIATIPWKTIKKDSIKILEDKDNQLKEELEKIMKS